MLASYYVPYASCEQEIYMEVADIHLEYGADASALGDDESTSLCQALSKRHADLAGRIQRHNPTYAAQAEDGWT